MFLLTEFKILINFNNCKMYGNQSLIKKRGFYPFSFNTLSCTSYSNMFRTKKKSERNSQIDSSYLGTSFTHKYSQTIDNQSISKQILSKKETLRKFFRIKKNKIPVTPRHTQSITMILNRMDLEKKDENNKINTTFRERNEKTKYYDKDYEIREYKERMKRLKENMNSKLKIDNSKKDKVVKIVKGALIQKKNFQNNILMEHETIKA